MKKAKRRENKRRGLQFRTVTRRVTFQDWGRYKTGWFYSRRVKGMHKRCFASSRNVSRWYCEKFYWILLDSGSGHLWKRRVIKLTADRLSLSFKRHADNNVSLISPKLSPELNQDPIETFNSGQLCNQAHLSLSLLLSPSPPNRSQKWGSSREFAIVNTSSTTRFLADFRAEFLLWC